MTSFRPAVRVGYEEQEYRVLKDATDWWKTEEYPDGPDFPQYAAKFQEEGWFDCRKWHPERWGTYRRWEMGYRRQQAGYNLYAAVDEKCAFGTPTGKVEIWSTICESYIGDTVSESYVLETPGTVCQGGREDPVLRPGVLAGSRRLRRRHSGHRQVPALVRAEELPRSGARVVRRQPGGRRVLQQRQLPEQALPRHRRRGQRSGDRQRRPPTTSRPTSRP